jgi:hypothetical protein
MVPCQELEATEEQGIQNGKLFSRSFSLPQGIVHGDEARRVYK